MRDYLKNALSSSAVVVCLSKRPWQATADLGSRPRESFKAKGGLEEVGACVAGRPGPKSIGAQRAAPRNITSHAPFHEVPFTFVMTVSDSELTEHLF